MVDICLLGTGGMYPLPERALTALYVRMGGHAMLVDCGEGTQTAIRNAGLRFKAIDCLLITHFHADHISGLPGLLLTMGNEGRDEPLHMYGPEGLAQIVNSLRAIVPVLPFEIIFHELRTDELSSCGCIGLDVTVLPLDHGIVPCVGYHFALKRKGKFSAQAAKEKGIPVQLWRRLQNGECVDGFTPEDVMSQPRRGLSFLYATDSRPVPAIQEYATDTDLLILEGMFGEAEKQERAEESHHMMMQEAAQIAAKAGTKELWLTHYSPATRDPAVFETELKEIFASAVIAADGQNTTLHFAEED